jgi:hypothetical protein
MRLPGAQFRAHDDPSRSRSDERSRPLPRYLDELSCEEYSRHCGQVPYRSGSKRFRHEQGWPTAWQGMTKHGVSGRERERLAAENTHLAGLGQNLKLRVRTQRLQKGAHVVSDRRLREVELLTDLLHRLALR